MEANDFSKSPRNTGGMIHTVYKHVIIHSYFYSANLFSASLNNPRKHETFSRGVTDKRIMRVWPAGLGRDIPLFARVCPR